MKKFLIGIALVAWTTVFASVIVTDYPGAYTRDGVTYESKDACVAAAQDGLAGDPRKCTQINETVVEGSCDDAPKPVEPARTYDPHLCPGTDSKYFFTEDHRVAVAYPKCWAIQPVVQDSACGELPPLEGETWVPPVTP